MLFLRQINTTPSVIIIGVHLESLNLGMQFGNDEITFSKKDKRRGQDGRRALCLRIIVRCTWNPARGESFAEDSKTLRNSSSPLRILQKVPYAVELL